MLSDILNTEVVAGVGIFRTHVVLTIFYILYNTIPRYYDEPKGEKKKRKMCSCLGFLVVGLEVFLMKRWNFPFKKMKSTIIIKK